MVPAEQALRVAGGGHRVVRRREDGEELVTAGVDLVARGSRDRLAQQLPDVGEDGLPLGAEVVGEARRASTSAKRKVTVPVGSVLTPSV